MTTKPQFTAEVTRLERGGIEWDLTYTGADGCSWAWCVNGPAARQLYKFSKVMESPDSSIYLVSDESAGAALTDEDGFIAFCNRGSGMDGSFCRAVMRIPTEFVLPEIARAMREFDAAFPEIARALEAKK